MFANEQLNYKETGAFSEMINAYLNGNEDLKQFYSFSPDLEGVRKAIEKKSGTIDRKALVSVLRDQYKLVTEVKPVTDNIRLLADENCYTICTAHQPNLATGPLYVIYKILHVIKLARYLGEQLPGHKFVPVFYMGSEDADQEELNHFTIHGKKYSWNAAQQGAVGKMKVNKELISLFESLQSQLGVWQHGSDWVKILNDTYQLGDTVQNSVFRLLHNLFGKFGLVVLIADDPRLKNQLKQIMLDDLITQKPSELVSASCSELEKKFHVQAHPRDINLFYLKEDVRERIEKKGNEFHVCNTDLKFSEEEIREELNKYPERFSPNVILRGIYQETILPNVIFVGGGGEVAYWLQFKGLFEHYQAPFPVLVLRNSFMIVEKHQRELIEKLSLTYKELFQNETAILNLMLDKEGKKPQLNGELKEIENMYSQLRSAAKATDPTLGDHVTALQTQAIARLHRLEQKMLRAERKKMDAQARQVKKLRSELFPGGGLQERTENIGSYYAKYGARIFDAILENSLALEQRFTVLHVDQ